MNIWDCGILTAVALAAFFAIRAIGRNRKNGCAGCCSECGHDCGAAQRK